jgi:hypothetical protein
VPSVTPRVGALRHTITVSVDSNGDVAHSRDGDHLGRHPGTQTSVPSGNL